MQVAGGIHESGLEYFIWNLVEFRGLFGTLGSGGGGGGGEPVQQSSSAVNSVPWQLFDPHLRSPAQSTSKSQSPPVIAHGQLAVQYASSPRDVLLSWQSAMRWWSTINTQTTIHFTPLAHLGEKTNRA